MTSAALPGSGALRHRRERGCAVGGDVVGLKEAEVHEIVVAVAVQIAQLIRLRPAQAREGPRDGACETGPNRPGRARR